MVGRPIAADLFEVIDGSPRLIGGRRKSDGGVVFPLPTGPDRDLYDRVRLSPDGRLWSFTVQRFRPKSPPYAGADDERSFRPYALGYVELAGEVIVEARLETDDIAGLHVGQPMTLALAPFPLAGGETVSTYVFRPAA